MDFNNIAMLTIGLGTECNIQCKYCTQHLDKNIRTADYPAVENFIIDLLPKIKRPKLTIKFFGGETLLYFDKIVKIISDLEVYSDKIDWLVYTNGLLLNNEMVDFFNRHKVQLVLSHDGPQTKATKGIDMLESFEFISIFKRLDYKSVYIVLTSYSQHIRDGIKYIKDRVGKNVIVIGHYLVNYGDPTVYDKLCDFDLPAWEAEIKSITEQCYFDIAEGRKTDELVFIFSLLLYCTMLLEGQLPVEVDTQGQFWRRLSIDISGNIILSASVYKIIGKNDDIDAAQTAYSAKYNPPVEPQNPTCKKCEYYRFCRGMDVSLWRQEHKDERLCEFMRIYFYYVIALAVKIIKNGIKLNPVSDRNYG